ncbi:MAG TPA: YfhO family protein [Acidimicrobiales bacterium]|nr:YfhO family protein [Acidimicrobiales bacterium]
MGAALFCFGPSLVGARTLVSVNFLSDFLPWAAGGNRSVGHELCQSDTVDSLIPAIADIRRRVFSGHLASWQNISTGGGPMSALPNQGLLDPLSLPYWIMPVRWAPAFVTLLCWVVAIGGSFLFLRRLSVGRAAATLAGFIFATSGFMVVWTNWPQTRTAALIPALFWATDRIVTRSRPSDVVLLAAVVASMLLGGFPAVTGYALYTAAGYFVVRTLMVHGRDWMAAARRVGLAAGGLVLGGALSAVQMLPFAQFYRSLDTGYRSGQAKAGLPLGGLVTTFAPNSNGLCIVGRSGAAVSYGPVNPIELVAYVGSAALVLALLGAAFAVASRRWNQRGTRAFFFAATVAIALLGWASPTARSLTAKLPVFSNNFIGRIRSVLGFTLAVLAAFGFDWLMSRRGRSASAARPVSAAPAAPAVGATRATGDAGPHPAAHWKPARAWRAAWAAAIVGGAVVAGVLVLRASHRDAFAGHYLHWWNHAIAIPAVLMAASAALAGGAVLWRRTGAGLAFLLLPVLVVAQGTAFFHLVMPGDDPKMFYPDTPDHRFLAAHLGHDRFASASLTLYPSTAYYYGLRSPTGHSFTDSKWLDLLRAVDPRVMASPTNSDFTGNINQNTVGDQPVLDQMGVRYAVLPPTELAGNIQPLPPGGSPVSSATGRLVCALPGGPIRGVTVRLAGPLTAARIPTAPTVHVEVTAGGTTLSSGLYLGAPGTPAGTTLSLPVAGEALAAGAPMTVSLWATGSSTPLVLDGSAGHPACAAVAPVADGLRLVFADPGAVIYQRLTALPRIRWASVAQVVPASAAQIALLHKGIPGSDVILSAPGPAAGGGAANPAANPAANLTVSDDSGDRIAARIDARTAGYLVVADPMQMPGWSVTVDGRRAAVLHANYAMVAVAVPAGRHQVAFTYTAPGQAAGAVITGAGLLGAGALLWYDRATLDRGAGRRRPRYRRTQRHRHRPRQRPGRAPGGETPDGERPVPDQEVVPASGSGPLGDGHRATET